jgi:hypothetical protein
LEEHIASIFRVEKENMRARNQHEQVAADLHDATSQKTAFFIVTAVKTSNLTYCITVYWRKSFLYKNEIASNAMSRNCFELLLQMWNFSSDEECPPNDIFHKIQPLVYMCILKFEGMASPGRTV